MIFPSYLICEGKLLVKWAPGAIDKLLQEQRRKTGANFTNDFSIVTQISFIIGFIVTTLQSIISLKKYAHAMTVLLSCHALDVIAIISLQLGKKQNENFIEFELRWKNHL